jgi:hypothetical protein
MTAWKDRGERVCVFVYVCGAGGPNGKIKLRGESKDTPNQMFVMLLYFDFSIDRRYLPLLKCLCREEVGFFLLFVRGVLIV